jgi:C1A family cysteine protease
MTKEEKKSRFGFKKGDNFKGKEIYRSLPTADLPKDIDWREKGAVQPVQDQGHCGSCWAFSAIGAMEGAHFIASGKQVKLSEQQCVDCVTEDKGCNGGWQADCMDYAVTDPMVTEKQYPYTGIPDSCFVLYNGDIKVKKYTQVPRHSR